MMFDGTFGRLDKHELAALVSCLVPVDRSNVSEGCGFSCSHCSRCCGHEHRRLQ